MVVEKHASYLKRKRENYETAFFGKQKETMQHVLKMQ